MERWMGGPAGRRRLAGGREPPVESQMMFAPDGAVDHHSVTPLPQHSNFCPVADKNSDRRRLSFGERKT